ncbi:MAG: FtsX-like permease family protein [Acidobacteria bacterium]|nr:FtsX-like permease family protein [Acidobacteriota bacterium]
MLRYLPYILKHLRHNWVRTGSTVAAMTVCIFLFIVLRTLLAAIDAGLASSSDQRLITRHYVSLIFNLPISYEDRIRTVDGVELISQSNWFGGVYKDPKNFFPNFAVDPETYFAAYPEYVMKPEDYRAFLRDRRGAVVGREIADRFGWKIGDVFQMESTIPTYRASGPLSFVVRAIYEKDEIRYPGTNGQLMFFHWNYLYEASGRVASPGTFITVVSDPREAASIARKIDALFANSIAQTKTETEAAFRAGFLAQIGPLAFLLNAIGLAVTFTILIVTANTMSMAVRERRKEIAVLKTLGFPSWLVMGLVLAESLTLGCIGGLTGLVFGRAMIQVLPGVPVIGDVVRSFPDFGLDPVVGTLAFGLAVTIAFSAGLFPAVLAYRTRTADLLRHI